MPVNYLTALIALYRHEGDASAATERMSLPIILLFGGFMIFLGFPAVAAVLVVVLHGAGSSQPPQHGSAWGSSVSQ